MSNCVTATTHFPGGVTSPDCLSSRNAELVAPRTAGISLQRAIIEKSL